MEKRERNTLIKMPKTEQAHQQKMKLNNKVRKMMRIVELTTGKLEFGPTTEVQKMYH
jgi:hypothetical protein